MPNHAFIVTLHEYRAAIEWSVYFRTPKTLEKAYPNPGFQRVKPLQCANTVIAFEKVIQSACWSVGDKGLRHGLVRKGSRDDLRS